MKSFLLLPFSFVGLSWLFALSRGLNLDITAESGYGDDGSLLIFCASWRMNAETHNIRNWKVVPLECEPYIRSYMLEGQYESDTEMVCREATAYAGALDAQFDGKDVWIFDIDDTALSNIQYYTANRFGAIPFNREIWVEWETKAIAPPIQCILSLYNTLIDAQWTVFFLTGRHEVRRNVTINNLLHSGYRGWRSLILRQDDDRDTTALSFKSAKRAELLEQGYRIWGNIGDQWSDLTGYATGERSFKIPNPMYYIA